MVLGRLAKLFAAGGAPPARAAAHEAVADLLVCPISKAPLEWLPSRQAYLSRRLNVLYPVVHGVPRFFPFDAEMLQPDDPEFTHD